MADQIAAISQIMCKKGVKALISTEPIIALMDKSYNAEYEQRTYQTGDTINIRIEDQPMTPAQSNVIQIDPVIQTQFSSTVLQYNDGYELSGLFELYSLGGEKLVAERVGEPRMKNMAVTSAVNCYTTIAMAMNFVGTAGTPLVNATDFGKARAILMNQLAQDDLFCAMSPDDMALVAGDLATKFNPTSDSSLAYLKGMVKEAVGFGFYETTNIPIHINGDAVGTGTANMAIGTPVTTGSNTVAVTGGTSAGWITKGSLIYFATQSTAPNVNAVQPNTKTPLSTLRYFTVAQDVQLSGGAGTITLTQAIYGPENNKLQNSTVLPTTQFVGIVGTASHGYRQMLFMKKKASAFFGLRLPDLIMQKVTSMTWEGVEIKVSAGSDLTNYQNIMRWDILITSVILQWRWVARAFTADLGAMFVAP